MGFDLQAVDNRSDAGYFRLTWSGMALMVELLASAGVLEDFTPFPAWPAPPVDYADRVDAGATLTNEDRRYEAEVQQLRSTPSQVDGYVPVWKLQTNEGWILLASECGLLSDALRRVIDSSELDEDTRGVTEEFADYLARHTAGAGVEVW